MIDLVFAAAVTLQQLAGDLEYLSWGPQPAELLGGGAIEYDSWVLPSMFANRLIDNAMLARWG